MTDDKLYGGPRVDSKISSQHGAIPAQHIPNSTYSTVLEVNINRIQMHLTYNQQIINLGCWRQSRSGFGFRFGFGFGFGFGVGSELTH